MNFNFKELPCTGEPGSHVGGKASGKYIAISDEGFNETSEPDVWLWVESETWADMCSDDWTGPAPAHVGSFPTAAHAGEPLFRHS